MDVEFVVVVIFFDFVDNIEGLFYIIGIFYFFKKMIFLFYIIYMYKIQQSSLILSQYLDKR